MTAKLNRIILALLSFFIVVSLISNTFDGDFGWNLRFGKDAWAGNFQYNDGYTWGHLNQPWVNHEWGGDLVYWLLYDQLGYFSLVIMVSLFLWLAFLLSLKIFRIRLTPAAIFIATVALVALDFVIAARLTTMSPLFFVLLWWTLEKLPQKKSYYWWPLLLWVWSFFHGSWVLGFIVINIYLGGNLVHLFLQKYKPSWAGPTTGWDFSTIKNVIIWQVIAGLVIMINPYGWQLWHEVFLYFGNSYYKSHITEWLPSYSFPVFWKPLVLTAVSMVLVYLGWRHKKINWPQLLLLIAFFTSAMLYKRNNTFLLLVCVPVLVAGWQAAYQQIKNRWQLQPVVGLIIIYLLAGAYVVWQLPTVRVNSDIWADTELIQHHGFPVEAVEWLRQDIGDKPGVRIFNEFSWGGYLNWQLPNSLVYLDGRSAATWRDKNGKLLLENYIDIQTKKNKLAEVERGQANYILLGQSQQAYPQPDWLNKFLFNSEDLDRILEGEEVELEKEIARSLNWELVYSDQTAKVWKYRP